MSQFDESFDYLSLLGLEPSALEVQPAAEIREAINRRKKEWTGQAINPLYQQQARANLERARQFEQILDHPDALAAYLGFHKAAQAERFRSQEAAVHELLSIAAGNGRKVISADQHALLQKVCDEQGIAPAVFEKVLRKRRLKIGENGPGQAICAAPYRQPALDRALYGQITGHLKVLGKESFYELLDLPATSSPGRIVSTARILFDRWSKALPKTSECVAWEKGLQACLTYLKDGPSKTRYDNALYNCRLDDFLVRVDLVLAAGLFTRDDFVALARIGVQDFGLASEVVHQTLRWRATTKGLALSRPVEVNVVAHGLVKCQRCFRLTEKGAARCRFCGSGLEIDCRNPACRRRLISGAKACGACGLPVGRGVQYAELLKLAGALIGVGDSRGTLEACRLAAQILPGPAIDELVARAGRVRNLATSIRRAAAKRRFGQVEREMLEILSLSPHFAPPGYPQLDRVSRFLGQLRTRLAEIRPDCDPETEARICLEVVLRWTDSDEALDRLRRLAGLLESTGRNSTALEIVTRLAELEPVDERWQAQIIRLEHRLREEREQMERVTRVHEQLREALAARRLFAAEKLLTELEGLGAAARATDVAAALRERLSQVREETESIRQAGVAGLSSDEQVERYRLLLERCRDNREALAALKGLVPSTPAAAGSATAIVHGVRRVVTWQPGPSGPPATDFVVERSVQRPSAKGNGGDWQTIYQGPETNVIDDEVLHAGAILRYSIRSVRRGAISVAGDVLHEFVVSSPPVFCEPLLLSQEVMGLRVRQRPGEIELKWHSPAGARQTLVERWRGTRDERPARPDLISDCATGLLVDVPPDAEEVWCYRVYCVYDGPSGDVLTPGAIVTISPERGASVEVVSSDAGAAIESADLAQVLAQAPLASAAKRADANPLKRMGLWPPVPKTG